MKERKRKQRRRLNPNPENHTPEWMKKHRIFYGIFFLILLATLTTLPFYIFGKSGQEKYQKSVKQNTNRRWGTQNKKANKILIEIKNIEQFKKYIEDGEIVSFTKQKDETKDQYILTGSLNKKEEFIAEFPVNRYNAYLEEYLDSVNITSLKVIPLKRGSRFSLFYLLPIIGIIILIRWLLSRRKGKKGADSQFNNMREHNKAKVELIEPGDMDTSFKDVAGCDEAKEDLEEVVAFLKNPEKFNYLGGKIPKGVLLIGSPGCGKTLLAKAVAGETSVPFFQLTGSSFVETFVGVGASRVRDMFAQATKKAPCIIFIDELDSVGKSRGGSLNDEKETTLNELLAEMDGFKKNNATIVVLAATNRPDQLDAALLRPGRFDRQIVVDKPDIKGREAILKIHAHGVKIANEKDLKIIAKRTPGLTGADLANIINEGALSAARKNKKQVGLQDLLDGISRAMAGQEQRSKQLSDEEKHIVAVHETGHAIVQFYTDDNAVIHKISIIKSGRGSLGYTLTLPKEDKRLMKKEDLENMIIGLLGGRAAEDVMLGFITTGAQNDLARVTDIAKKYVSVFGMDKDFGLLSYGQTSLDYLGNTANRDDYSEKTAQLIDEKVKNLVDESYKKTKEEIKKHTDIAEKMVKQLEKKEVLETEEIATILKRKPTQ